MHVLHGLSYGFISVAYVFAEFEFVLGLLRGVFFDADGGGGGISTLSVPTVLVPFSLLEAAALAAAGEGAFGRLCAASASSGCGLQQECNSHSQR